VTYLAFFSMTYLATSLKLAKFSVTERTTDLEKFAEFNYFVNLCEYEEISPDNLISLINNISN